MSEESKRKHIQLIEQEDAFLLKEIGAVKDEIKTREDLKRFHFKCPICTKTKRADNAVVLQSPLEFSQKSNGTKVSVDFSCWMLIVCKECANKLPKKERVS